MSNREVKKWQAAHEEAMKRKQPIEYKAVTSTATTGEFGGNIKLRIAARGHQGVWVDPVSYHQGEREVLFPAGTRFMVDGVERRGDELEIYLTEDPAAFVISPQARLTLPYSGGSASSFPAS